MFGTFGTFVHFLEPQEGFWCRTGLQGVVRVWGGARCFRADFLSRLSPSNQTKNIAMASPALRAEGERLCDAGVKCFFLRVNCSKGKKDVFPPKGWLVNASADKSKLGLVGNALGILTGKENDLFLIDIDQPSMDLFSHLESVHGALDAPRVATCSGGQHLYFGYKASVEAGLTSMRNQTRLKIGGEQTCVDTRGDGGFVIAPPTQVRNLGQYKWVTPEPDLRAGSLPALPAWLVAAVNGSISRTFRSTSAPLIDDQHQASVGELGDLIRLLREFGDKTSTYRNSKKRSSHTVTHYFNTRGTRRCPYDGPVHDSDNFALLVRGNRVFYHCFSPSCNAIDPFTDSRGALGTLLPYEAHEARFDSERLYELYFAACRRTADLVAAEGPGDDSAEEEAQELPAAVSRACKRDVLAYLNRFFFFSWAEATVYEVQWRQDQARVQSATPRRQAEFHALLRNVHLSRLGISKLSEWWLNHRHRSCVSRVAYFPGHEALHEDEASSGKLALNKFPGFVAEPDGGELYRSLGELGDLVPIFHHLHYCWCRGDTLATDWILGWLAHIVQRPRDKPGVALVLNSVREGAGKGVLLHWIGEHVIGMMQGSEQYVCVQGYERICGEMARFGQIIAEKLLCCIDEGELPDSESGKKKIMAALKSTLTEPFGILEKKFFEAVQVLSCVRVAILTNMFAPVLFGRRFAAFQLDDSHAHDPAYFQPLKTALNKENGKLFLSYLSGFELSSWSPATPPDTPYSRLLRRTTAPILLRFFGSHVGAVEATPPGTKQTMSTRDLSETYRAWADAEGESIPRSVSKFAACVAHYGLAKYDIEKQLLHFERETFIERMLQLLPREVSRSSSKSLEGSFFARPSPETAQAPKRRRKTATHQPRPPPCGRPIRRPDNILIARQGSDAKCALWALQTIVQDTVDFEPYLDDGARSASSADVRDSFRHGQGGNWSISAVARALSSHGRFRLQHVGERRSLAALEPAHGDGRVCGLLVLHMGHYTARLLAPGGQTALKCDSLRPDVCLEMTGAELEADLDLHRCAYQVLEGCDDVDDSAFASLIADISNLERARVATDCEAGVWDIDASDPLRPRLVWVPARDLDASVFTWMRAELSRASNIELDEESDLEAVDPAVPAGGGSSMAKSVSGPDQRVKPTPRDPMEIFADSFVRKIQDHDGQEKCPSFKSISEVCKKFCGFPSLEDARAALLQSFQYKAPCSYTYVTQDGTSRKTSVNGLVRDGRLQMLKD